MNRVLAVKYRAKALKLGSIMKPGNHNCIWADTKDAKSFGATQEEIAEAVAMAGLTRHWSTFFNGMQLDFGQFKKEMGGE